MSTSLLAVLVLTTAAAVVVAMFIVLWRERTSDREARVALASGVVLALWGAIATLAASRGLFRPPDTRSAPPVGIALALALAGLAASVAGSPSLRRLLTNQKNLIRLNVWRLVGLVFLALMAYGQVPPLWALPAGIGDVLVGATAFWVAGQVDRPKGRGRAIAFHLLGLADLVVAVGLGVATSPGPTQIFHATPTSERMTEFPMAVVPTFLVPLAVALHVVSLVQLLRGSWASRAPASRGSL